MQKQKQNSTKKKFSKIYIALFVFIILNIFIIVFFYCFVPDKVPCNNCFKNNKISKIIHKCSSEHPKYCNKSCNIDADCYPSCTRNCGCLKSGEVCNDENTICEITPFSCKCVNNKCEVIEYNKVNINIIGDYIHEIMSMCSQNCEKYYVGDYELVNELTDIDGINKDEIIFAQGNMTTITEPPTIAGPDSYKQDYEENVESVKLKVDNYKKINFPKISISGEELSNYLNNENTKFIFEFENPLDEELKFKAKMKEEDDFQYFTLQPKKTKNFEYIYVHDFTNTRSEDDGFDLVVVNDFVDDKNLREYYQKEADNINSSGTMIYVETYVRLEDFETEIDTSNWQIYRNEEYGFEVKYPSFLIFSRNGINSNKGEEEDITIFSDSKGDYSISIRVYNNPFKSEDAYYREIAEAMEYPYNEAKDSMRFIEIENQKWVELWGSPGPYYNTELSIPHKKKIYEFELQTKDRFENLDSQPNNLTKVAINNFKLMLSTFKFTDELDTSDWQTYRNEEYEYEIKYPKDWRQTEQDTYLYLGPINIPEDALFVLNVVDGTYDDAIKILDDIKVFQVIETEKIVFNEMDARRVIILQTHTNQEILRILIKHNTNIFVLSTTNDNIPDPYNNYIKRISSTFKFTN